MVLRGDYFLWISANIFIYIDIRIIYIKKNICKMESTLPAKKKFASPVLVEIHICVRGGSFKGYVFYCFIFCLEWFHITKYI